MNTRSRRDFIRRFALTTLGLSVIPALRASEFIEAGTISALSNRTRTGQMPNFEPAYLRLHRNGELAKRGVALKQMMHKCSLCPRNCGVNRLKGARGICGSTDKLKISSFNPHFGEEQPLVGTHGSGTVFFSNCALLCVFCINWQISHDGQGAYRTPRELAQMMLSLQKIGCHNINVVTPSHYSAQIVEALNIAAGRGLTLPVVYNTCGWEKMEVLQLLDGIVDIYLPDYKYTNPSMAGKYSAGAYSYPEITQNALIEMNRQVGVATPDSDGLMRRGLMIRHLVMPNNVGGSADAMRWIAANLPKNTYVNIMSQYRPMHRASEFPDIARRITTSEYRQVIDAAREAGLTNLDVQGG